MPTISVIVPVYNAEKYLHRCVDSILNQTFTDFELILVDDGSSDNCGTICDKYAEKDARVRVIFQQNRGQAAARNTAMKIVTSVWTCFVDADDFIHISFLSIMLSAISEQKGLIVCCHPIEGLKCPQSFFQSIDYAEFEIIKMDESNLSNLFKDSYTCWVVCCKVISTEIVRKYPFTEGRVYEDNAIVVKWLYEAGTILYSDTTLYFYQINPEGTTNSSPSTKKRLDYLWALSEQMIFFLDHRLYRMIRQRLNPFLNSCTDIFYNTYITDPIVSKKAQKMVTCWLEYEKQHPVLTNKQRRYYRTVNYVFWLKTKRLIKKVITRDS